MFQHIKDIKELIGNKNDQLEEALTKAELNFSTELKKAIYEEKKLKRALQKQMFGEA